MVEDDCGPPAIWWTPGDSFPSVSSCGSAADLGHMIDGSFHSEFCYSVFSSVLLCSFLEHVVLKLFLYIFELTHILTNCGPFIVVTI